MRPPDTLLPLTLLLCGCSPLLPDYGLPLTSTVSVSAADATIYGGLAVATYLYVDPLAPNWEVREQRVGDNTWNIALQRKRFVSGGDGECGLLFQRSAQAIASRQGAPGYEVRAYTEGLDSETLGPRRWARATIELLPRPAPAPAPPRQPPPPQAAGPKAGPTAPPVHIL